MENPFMKTMYSKIIMILKKIFISPNTLFLTMILVIMIAFTIFFSTKMDTVYSVTLSERVKISIIL
ncbi:MAG: hypothetical protein GY839_21395 [candidate division Zixibacteria bacterium]|nr:hypothetical protein [candidate division Zixibacteria bacterium]